jgi:hypothetical protein
MEEVKDINQLDNEKDQRLHGVVSLVVSKLEVEKLLIVGYFVLVQENFRDNSIIIYNDWNLILKTKF